MLQGLPAFESSHNGLLCRISTQTLSSLVKLNLGHLHSHSSVECLWRVWELCSAERPSRCHYGAPLQHGRKVNQNWWQFSSFISRGFKANVIIWYECHLMGLLLLIYTLKVVWHIRKHSKSPWNFFFRWLLTWEEYYESFRTQTFQFRNKQKCIYTQIFF